MAICPNINSPQWKELVKAQGEEQAYFLWNNFDGSVPGEYTNTVPVESNLSKVKELIAKMGVNLTDLQTYASENPDMDIRGANSIADAVGKLIAVSEGATQEDITEEMVHIATQILEQQNPELVTEMISKIGGFKIYGETLEKYREVPAYQLPDGRPNIRKIKKEAADKLIAYIVGQQLSDVEASNIVEADELTEEDRSLFKRIWDAITGWFRGVYAESNVDIFQKIADIITTEGVEGELLDGTPKELYFTLTDPQKKIQNRILNTKKNIRKIESSEPINPLLQDQEDGNSFYEVKQGDDYVRVKNRVTDRVKRWYRQRFPGDPNFTDQEKIDNNVKRELGIEFHNMFEAIHALND